MKNDNQNVDEATRELIELIAASDAMTEEEKRAELEALPRRPRRAVQAQFFRRGKNDSSGKKPRLGV